MIEEELTIHDGQMWVPDRPGLGVTLTGQARAWTVARETFTG
jgi:L-talarate/galactarate dehydratase